mgnify:CR=1 FL=1
MQTCYPIFYCSMKNELEKNTVIEPTSADKDKNSGHEAPTTSLVESVSFSFTVPIKVIIVI